MHAEPARLYNHFQQVQLRQPVEIVGDGKVFGVACRPKGKLYEAWDYVKKSKARFYFDADDILVALERVRLLEQRCRRGGRGDHGHGRYQMTPPSLASTVVRMSGRPSAFTPYNSPCAVPIT